MGAEPRAHFGTNGQTYAREAQQAAAWNLLVACGTVAYLLLWYIAIDVKPQVVPLALLMACATALVLMFFAARKRPDAARVGLLALTWVVVGGGTATGDLPTYTLAVPALVAGSVYGPTASLAAGLGAAALAWLASPHEGLLLPLFVGGAGLIMSLTLAPLTHLLAWHGQRSLEATSLSEQLKDQRGKLNRTIKDLDLSYKLLQQTNHDLAVARREAETLYELRHGFATNLSHELRTPLNIILGFAQLVYVNPKLYGYTTWSDALRRDLAEIRRNAGYLSDLVDDIIDLARVDALAMPIHREPSDLRALIDEAVESVASLARSKGLALTVGCPNDLPLLNVDPLRVKQVLVNLLTNAVRYTDHGSVTVRVGVEEEVARVSVADTGCGISPEEQSTIFNEFYQVGRPKGGRSAGKGLGLAIARRFVHLHGGSIWVESEAGHGSTFHFTLPLSDKRVGMLHRSSDARIPPSSRRPVVVVVNDDGMAASYLSRRIEDYEFRPVDAGQDVAALAWSEAVSAVIVNTGADAQGFPVGLVSALPENVPVIQCSLPSTSWLGSQHSLSTVLSKPVSAESLLATIDSVVAGDSALDVLLVDDDRGFVQLLRRMLEASPSGKYTVRTAYTGMDALARMQQRPPDVLVLDLVMPEMSGFEVLEAMHQDDHLNRVAVVAVTAATPGEDRIAAEGTAFTVAKRGSLRPGELVGLISAGLAIGHETLGDRDEGGAA